MTKKRRLRYKGNPKPYKANTNANDGISKPLPGRIFRRVTRPMTILAAAGVIFTAGALLYQKWQYDLMKAGQIPPLQWTRRDYNPDVKQAFFWFRNQGKTPLKFHSEAFASGPAIPSDCGRSLPLTQWACEIGRKGESCIFTPPIIPPGGEHMVPVPLHSQLEPGDYVFGYLKTVDFFNPDVIHTAYVCFRYSVSADSPERPFFLFLCPKCTNAE